MYVHLIILIILIRDAPIIGR